MNREAAHAPLRILGGGPAGLAAARHAHARGIPFTLHEASATTGGNCRTLRLGDCRYDTGAHRLHMRDPDSAAAFRDLLGDDLLFVDAPSRIVRAGKTFAFPPVPRDLLRGLSVREIARVGVDALLGTVRGASRRPPASFHELAVGRYGRTLADLFLLGYTRKLWGREPADLSPDIAGGRLDGLNARTLLRAASRVLTPNPPSAPAAHLDGAFLYPKHGIGSLFDALVAHLPASSVRLRERVTHVRHDGGRVIGIRVENEAGDATELEADRMVSTLPLPALVHALDPPLPDALRERADRIAFRNLILCVLRLARPRFSANASLYFPDPGIPFTRLYEPKNRSPRMAPPDETCIVLEIPCAPEDEIWNDADSAVVERSVTALEGVCGPLRADLREAVVQRVGYAYPVLERRIAEDVNALLARCDAFPNLRLAGRNALFRYAHIHDMFRQGRGAVDALLPP